MKVKFIIETTPRRFLCKRSPRFGKGWSTIEDTKSIDLSRKFSKYEDAENVLRSIHFIYADSKIIEI
jgi:hypothetical protein